MPITLSGFTWQGYFQLYAFTLPKFLLITEGFLEGFFIYRSITSFKLILHNYL